MSCGTWYRATLAYEQFSSLPLQTSARLPSQRFGRGEIRRLCSRHPSTRPRPSRRRAHLSSNVPSLLLPPLALELCDAAAGMCAYMKIFSEAGHFAAVDVERALARLRACASASARLAASTPSSARTSRSMSASASPT